MRRFRWSCLFLALALVFAMSSVCFAAEFNFSTQKKDVDSNSYSYIGSAKKDSTTDYAELKLTKIYKANGDDSSYSYVYAKANSNGTQTLIQKGSWVNVPIPAGAQAAGRTVNLYCKGHNPSLDCKISGFWNVH